MNLNLKDKVLVGAVVGALAVATAPFVLANLGRGRRRVVRRKRMRRSGKRGHPPDCDCAECRRVKRELQSELRKHHRKRKR